MRLVPLIIRDKPAANKAILADGGEGLMLKDIKAPYIHEGRPKSMYKLKRREEIDAFVVDGRPGEEGKGWELLIGDIGFGAITEKNQVHLVARCSNLELEQRIDASVCKKCGGTLAVQHANVDGKRIIQGTTCQSCGVANGGAALNPAWVNRVAEITGQEWTARVYRLKHAVVSRWRVTGEDAKSPGECRVNLHVIQRRFVRAAIALDAD